MSRINLRRAGLLGFSLLFAVCWLPPAALAHKNNTQGVIGFSPASPVVDGTIVTVTGTFTYDGTQGPGSATGHPTPTPAPGAPITDGIIQIEELQDADGNGVPCDTPDATYVNLGQGAPNGMGKFSVMFDTTGLGGQTIGFRGHHPATAGSHGDAESKSECFDLEIVESRQDPLPDGTISFTQGFFGSSPGGEAVVPDLIDEATCTEINAILGSIDEGGAPYHCSTDDGRSALALFLTGTVGRGDDGGFLPSGFSPGENLAAQKIALLLNLNLAAILEPPAIPLLDTYFLNVDAVQDVVDGVPDGFYDPILTTGGKLGTCTDSEPDGVCDAGTVVLSALGVKATALDAAGTTVADILAAADALISSGDPSIDVNGVTLTAGDLTSLLGLINESYDEGVPTGFVTSFDAD